MQRSVGCVSLACMPHGLLGEHAACQEVMEWSPSSSMKATCSYMLEGTLPYWLAFEFEAYLRPHNNSIPNNIHIARTNLLFT